ATTSSSRCRCGWGRAAPAPCAPCPENFEGRHDPADRLRRPMPDAEDPRPRLRGQFDLPDGVIYLDGNSLGVLPRATVARTQQVVQDEWGRGLIRSWNSAGWIDMPQRIGDKIARLVGAGAGEVVVAD